MILAERAPKALPEFLSNRNSSEYPFPSRRGGTVFSIGDEVSPNRLYGVKSGLAVREVANNTGKVYVVEVFKPGEYFGAEDWGRHVRSSTVRMVNKGEIVRTTIHPSDKMTRMEIFDRELDRLARMREANQVLTLGGAEERVSYALLDFGLPNGAPDQLVLPGVTQDLISERIGKSRQATNREIKCLKQEEMVVLKGNTIHVPDKTIIRGRTRLNY